MLLSIVFSFRNEELLLNTLLTRMTGVLEPLALDYELIFVNDDSSDGSLDILLERRKQDKRIKIVNTSRRFGFYPCVMAGFRYAAGDAVIYMATDMQDPPELIAEMIERYRAGAEVVNTVRTRRLGESAFKMWVTKQAYRMINRLSDVELPENMGDFKLLSRRVVNELLKLEEVDPYLRGIVRWLGFRQETLYYERPPRLSGKTHFPLLGRAPVEEFVRGITSFSAAPLYLALIYGFTISILSFVYLLVVLITKLMGYNIPGWTAIMATLLFLGGNMLLTNGFLGLYIARIYDQIKNRPRYIVRDAVGFDEDIPGPDRERGARP